MRWIELTATYPEVPEDWSPIVEILGGLGCPNTLQGDAPPTITACLLETDASPARLAELAEALTATGATKVEHRFIEEEDWAEAYKKHFHTRRVGNRFVITPTWEPCPSEPGDLVITLDPGLAFGTGDHPTTRMCLELMEEAGVEGAQVADVGCGTGILSIGAVLLGAKRVCGVDIEAQSVVVAQENAILNKVDAEFVVGDGLDALIPPEGGWDVLLSNIISATLINLAPTIAAHVRPNGRWILSGVLIDNWPDVRKAAEHQGFELVRLQEDIQWVAALFVKK